MPLCWIPDIKTLNQCCSKLVFLSWVWWIFQAQDSSFAIWNDSSLSKDTFFYLHRRSLLQARIIDLNLPNGFHDSD